MSLNPFQILPPSYGIQALLYLQGKTIKKSMKLTILQANALIRRCEHLHKASVRAYDNDERLKLDRLQLKIETILGPLGIILSYPNGGPIPVYITKQGTSYTVEAAVSAALEGDK